MRAIPEGLHQEMDTLRITLISPTVTETELGSDITDKDSAEFLKQVRKTALPP